MKVFLVKIHPFFQLFALVFLIYSCKSPRHKHPDKNVFKYNEAANIVTLDPAFARDQAHIWVCNQLYNGLVQLDDALDVKPSIAKNWTISDDGLLYTFTLRDDVYFHDDPVFKGERRKVVASDFVYSFSRLLDEKTASPGVWVLSAVNTENAQAFSAPSDTIFQIQIGKPFPPFLGILSMQYCSVLPREVVEYYGNDFRKHAVGTGPFMLQNWEENIKLVLRKNPHYFEQDHGDSIPYLDGVSISFLIDKMTAFMEFAQGNLHFMSGIDASYKDELLSRDGSLREKYSARFNMSKIPYLNTEYIGILVDTSQTIVRESPLQLKKVRQAISYGFDRKKMMYFLRNNIGSAGIKGIIPKGLPSYDQHAQYGYDYDPEKSRELMAQAGFSEANPMPPVKLVTTSNYLDLCKFLQSQLQQTGLNITIEVVPPAAAIEMRALSKVLFFRASWIADYPDEENYLSLFYSGNFAPNGPNYTHFSNALFDGLYEESYMETDALRRQKLYRSMDSIVMDEAPVIILYYDEVLRFTQRKVSGLGNNPINLLNLKTVRLN